MKISIQFFGGRGSGGGKRSGGGGGGSRSGEESTVQTVYGVYTKSEPIKFNETDTRYTIPGSNERIYKTTTSNIVDRGETVVNKDGSTTYTFVQKGNKGNTYIVQATYKEASRGFGSASELYKVKTTISKAQKR